jgi:hypothetical protein
MQMLETAIKVGTIFILKFTPFPLSHFWLHEVAQRALEILVINIFFEQQPLLPLLLPGLHFSDYSFLVQHPVNRDDWHLLAHATP